MSRPLIQTEEDSPVRAAYDEVAEIYDQNYRSRKDRAEDRLIRRILEKGYLGGQVLDVGCGTGYLLDNLWIPAGQYCGVDLSPGMVRVAADKWQDYRFEVGDLQNLRDIRGESFDTALSMFGTFNYCLRASSAVNELARVLRPGGKLLMVVYGVRHVGVESYILHRAGKEEDVPRILYSARSLKRTLSESFENVKVHGMSAFIGALPDWVPEKVFDSLLRVEAASIGRIAPSLCLHLIATATRPEGARVIDLRR